MKPSVSLIAAALVAIALPAVAQTLHFKTEVYPPYSYREGKEYRGASIEQVQQIMKDVPADYTIEIMPWARAYALAQLETMTCVFTAAHTPERDKLFKWIQPLSVDRVVLVSHAGSGVEAPDIPKARSYVVGTQRNDYTYTLLQQLDFTKIDIASEFDITLKKLLADRIALMPLSQQAYRKLKREGAALDMQTILTEQHFAIACNKDVPDNLVDGMQTALDRLISDGRQAEIFHKYGLEPSE